jgi:ethanolamine ammonia-lyase small subunit
VTKLPVSVAGVSNARLSLGQEVAGLPTTELLRFRLDHAAARQAVWTPLDVDALGAALASLGLGIEIVGSRATDRQSYLRRPDLGRRLADGAAEALAGGAAPTDVAIVVADGLSSDAVHCHAPEVLAELLPRLAGMGLSMAPLVIATNARVAIADEIGSALRARCTIILIGERPGLSSPDSLGAYLTFAPAIGLPDSRRNCVSNIHDRGGLSAAAAAESIAALVAEMFARGTSGTALNAEQTPRLEG